MSRLEQLGPVWLRWVPRPAIGLPILIGASGAVAAGTLAFGWPLGVLTLVAIPIPFTGIRWSRGPSYAAIAGLLVAGLVTTDVHSNDEAYAFLRTFIQVGVIALLWEATHSASRMGSRAIEALAENEARYRRLAEGSNVIPFEFDLATMRFTYVGPHAEEVLGFPAEAWLGDGFWHDRLHPEDRDAALAFCEAATARGEDHDFDYRMIGSSDQPVWIHDIVSVVKGQGAVRSLRGVMVDITKRKQAEQEHRDLEARMVESQKLESLGLIAGGVAHDFNNLLTAVLGNAALALEDLPPHHPGRERIEDLVTAAERGSELTGQMLTYAGRTSPGTPPRDLSKVTGETVRLLASSISKKARLKIHLEPSIW
ncbi:MAG: PAS domain S-box protein, partial [bacterium]|nr:PAS domain S-box protein [bacterium]